MTLVTLRPATSITIDGVTTVGAATPLAATQDDLDSSYVTSIGPDDEFEFAFALPSAPAGSVAKGIAYRARIARTGSTATKKLDFELRVYRGSSKETHKATPSITNATPATSQIFAFNLAPGTLVADITQLWSEFEEGNSSSINVYATYLDFIYVTQPVVVVATFSPTTITTSNVPLVTWSTAVDSDSDGGVQYTYETKMFASAVYSAGGFDVNTSSYIETSGTVISSDKQWQPTVALANGTYRCYVRASVAVNGSQFQSAWTFTEFIINITPPPAPTITLTAEPAKARNKINGKWSVGTTSVTHLEFQRSTDGGSTWAPARLLTADSPGMGVTSNIGVVAVGYTWMDYEAGNGQTVFYRVRALHDFGGGQYGTSAWVQSSTAWSDATPSAWWLKCVENPSLNAKVTIYSLPAEQRPARMTPFQALSSPDTIIVSDVRGASRGTLQLWCDNAAQRASLDALIDSNGTLLLQGAVNDNFRARYVRLGDHDRTRIVDKSWIVPTIEQFAWWEVAYPVDTVNAWPA